MSRKRKPHSEEDWIRRRWTAQHLATLRMDSEAEYLEWCNKHGFARVLHKSEVARRRELKFRREEGIHNTMKYARRTRDPAATLIEVAGGRMEPEDVRRVDLRQACQVVANAASDEYLGPRLEQMLGLVGERSRLLNGVADWSGRRVHCAVGVVHLFERHGQWLRPLEEWSPRKKNRDHQFSSLARHLLARWPVPTFMDSVWFSQEEGPDRHRDWFVHMGAGQNIRTADTPVRLTKREAHHFLEAPDDYTAEQALRWGQIHALGGDAPLCDAVVATPIGGSFENEEFWSSVLRWFVEQPMLDRVHVGPIVDWIQGQRFLGERIIVGPGIERRIPPPRPNLSMHRRDPTTLLREVRDWHRALGHQASKQHAFWAKSGIAPLQWQTGKGKQRKTWRLRELLGSSDLRDEGRALGHCVASYTQSCVSGRCSIWSLQVENDEGVRRLQTVEVNRERVITQSRGKHNALPGQSELSALRRWATHAELQISRWIG